MKIVNRVEEVINPQYLPKGTMVYCAGNASTPQLLLQQIVDDKSIKDISMLSLLLLGDNEFLFLHEYVLKFCFTIYSNNSSYKKTR